MGANGGQILGFGFWPGVTYFVSQDTNDWLRDIPTHLPQGWAADVRGVATLASRLAKVGKHADVDIPGVELLVMDASDGIMVTVLGWTGPVRAPLQLTIHKRLPSFSECHPPLPVTATSVKHGVLQLKSNDKSFIVTLPALDSVDVVVIRQEGVRKGK
jgi:hypothetical protein